MPTNVSQQYMVADMEYQKASTPEEKVTALKKMFQELPKHKGTENLRMEIKNKISRYSEILRKEAKRKKGHSEIIKKEGAAQAVLVGIPNSGKSTIMQKLTNAKPEIANYPFTTTRPELGILDHKGIKIQMVELPGLVEGMSEKSGLFFAHIRNADLIILIINDEKDLEIIIPELENKNIIVNKKRPNIQFKKFSSGGIEVFGINNIDKKLEEIKQFLENKGIKHAILNILEKSTMKDVELCLDEGKAFMNSLILFNAKQPRQIPEKLNNIEVITLDDKEINSKIWKALEMVAIYTKEPGKPADMKTPVIVDNDSTIRDVAEKIHKDFVKRFRFARIWGTSAKFDAQKIGLDHKVGDGDIIEFHIN